MLNLKKYKNALLVIVGASFCLVPLHGMKNNDMDIDVSEEKFSQTSSNFSSSTNFVLINVADNFKEKIKEKATNRIRTLFGYSKNYAFHTRTEKWLLKRKNQHKLAFITDSRKPVQERVADFINKRIKTLAYVSSKNHLIQIKEQLISLITFLAKKIYLENVTKSAAYNKAYSSITNDPNNTFKILNLMQKKQIVNDIMMLVDESLTKVKKWYCLE